MTGSIDQSYMLFDQEGYYHSYEIYYTDIDKLATIKADEDDDDEYGLDDLQKSQMEREKQEQ